MKAWAAANRLLHNCRLWPNGTARAKGRQALPGKRARLTSASGLVIWLATGVWGLILPVTLAHRVNGGPTPSDFRSMMHLQISIDKSRRILNTTLNPAITIFPLNFNSLIRHNLLLIHNSQLARQSKSFQHSAHRLMDGTPIRSLFNYLTAPVLQNCGPFLHLPAFCGMLLASTPSGSPHDRYL